MSKVISISPDSGPEKNGDDMIVTLRVSDLRAIVREEIAAALANAKPSSQKEWMKAVELADLYGMPKTWFEERGRAGDIERAKPGRYVLFKRRDVEAFLEKNKRNGTT